VCSSRNVALVESLGATVLDYTKGDPLEAARAHRPFELVFHAVGTETYPLSPCRELLTPTGSVALVVVHPLADALAIAFTQGVRASLGRSTGALLGRLAESVAKGELKCVIEAKLPLAEAEEAHARSRRGKVVGKLLLEAS
jgi:NADPH:quinone reductase-like Zn-dependent oxidoreductase